MEFEKFGSLTRFSQGWTITEKIDGSNGQIAILDLSKWDEDGYIGPHPTELAVASRGDLLIMAGSRNKWLDTTKQGDHMGFAKFVEANAEELIEKLGEGRHYGEWYGGKIQRGYGLKEKRFALFNAHRWSDDAVRPECCEVVHSFTLDEYFDCPNIAAAGVMALLKIEGSFQVPGFMNPEGVVMFHRPSQTSFKKTFDYDERGKWAENQGVREL